MVKTTLDGIKYDTESLSVNGKAQLASIQFLHVQMQHLKNEISAYQTARFGYATALKAELAKVEAK
jgi:hypothetical protein